MKVVYVLLLCLLVLNLGFLMNAYQLNHDVKQLSANLDKIEKAIQDSESRLSKDLSSMPSSSASRGKPLESEGNIVNLPEWTRQIEALLDAKIEVLLEEQDKNVGEYFNSVNFEQRLWDLIYDFSLDFAHPEFRENFQAELDEIEKEYWKEEYKRTPEKWVINNLRQIASAGQQYILETGESQANYNQLVGDYFMELEPINGENYTTITIKETGGTISVIMQNGQEVTFTY